MTGKIRRKIRLKIVRIAKLSHPLAHLVYSQSEKLLTEDIKGLAKLLKKYPTEVVRSIAKRSETAIFIMRFKKKAIRQVLEFFAITATKPKAFTGDAHMKLEQQVSSLELSKKLKELGVKQESLFEWRIYLQEIYPFGLRESSIMRSGSTKDSFPTDLKDGKIEIISAFTVAELGEMLQRHICWTTLKTAPGNKYRLIFSKIHFPESDFSQFDADTEADARAKMLIHLTEKGIVKP